MFAALVIFLVALGGAKAQDGTTCCAQSYTSYGYDGLQETNVTTYYDSDTGRLLEENDDGTLTIFFDSSTDTVYYRSGTHCLQTKEVSETVKAKSCIPTYNTTFLASQTVNGEVLYEWDFFDSLGDEFLFWYNADCVLVKSADLIGDQDDTYTLKTGEVDVSVFESFDTTGCVVDTGEEYTEAD